MKKRSVSSRRNFLKGMAVTAGVAALPATVKTFGKSSKSKASLLDAWTSKPRSINDMYMSPVKVHTRKLGSQFLPLAQRPF